jgi:hypothetical protein
MHRLIREYLNACQAVVDAQRAQGHAEDAADDPEAVPLPENLRPAVASDIVEGAIIWYPRFRESSGTAGWKLVAEPLHYGDEWKAYHANDGCRYGLHGAFIEITQASTKGTE